MKKLLFCLLLPLIIFSCSEEKLILRLDNDIIISPGERVFVKDGLTGFSIEFAEVIENSLCPPHLICVWGGRQIVKLIINHEFEMILGSGSLSASESYVNSARYQDYQITFLEAIPTKLEEGYIYDIKLKVEKE